MSNVYTKTATLGLASAGGLVEWLRVDLCLSHLLLEFRYFLVEPFCSKRWTPKWDSAHVVRAEGFEPPTF